MNSFSQTPHTAYRPMRRKARQINDVNDLRAVVEECTVVRLGIIDDEGMFIVPVNFGYDWDMARNGGVAVPKLSLWIHSAAKGRKADAFARIAAQAKGQACEQKADQANCQADCQFLEHTCKQFSRIAIEMDHQVQIIAGNNACDYSTAYRSLMGWGTIYPARNLEEKWYGLMRLMDHMAPGSPVNFSQEMLAATAVYRIDVDYFTGKEHSV